jgi:hypothetical protein
MTRYPVYVEGVQSLLKARLCVPAEKAFQGRSPQS